MSFFFFFSQWLLNRQRHYPHTPILFLFYLYPLVDTKKGGPQSYNLHYLHFPPLILSAGIPLIFYVVSKTGWPEALETVSKLALFGALIKCHHLAERVRMLT